MFFDEELEVIFGEHLDDETPKGFVDDLMKCWKRRMPQPNVGVQTFINEVRKMDYSWQLFCKKHKGFKIDAFRTLVLNCADDELKEKFRKAFHW